MDGVNEEEARVVIRLRDVNGLPPIFLQTKYEAIIFEESIHRYRPIITVSAHFVLVVLHFHLKIAFNYIFLY